MSRTIRRKNAYSTWRRALTVDRVDSGDLHKYDTQDPKMAVLRSRVHFHADNRSGQWGVPHWYSHTENLRHKHANEKELNRCWKLGSWDDHAPPPMRRTTIYYWWY